MKGLTQQWTIWCDKCCHWNWAGGVRSRCVRFFRKAGWRQVVVKTDGRRVLEWRCPNCAKEK